MNRVTTITRNGTASLRPCLPQPGHQVLALDMNCSSACSAPSASAPSSAIHNELSRAMSAAARAGTTSRVRFAGVSTPTAGPAMIMVKDTSTVASTQVTMPRVWGDSRANAAARSFSAAAWMARPVRERLNQNASAAPSTTTSAVNQSRSTATLAPAILTVPVGSSASSGRGMVPYFRATPACSVNMMPTAATTLASTGAVRSGRETSISISAPSAAATRSAITTDTQVGGGPILIDGSNGMGSVNFPACRSLNTYSGTVATAAAAKLITPVPW